MLENSIFYFFIFILSNNKLDTLALWKPLSIRRTHMFIAFSQLVYLHSLLIYKGFHKANVSNFYQFLGFLTVSTIFPEISFLFIDKSHHFFIPVIVMSSYILLNCPEKHLKRLIAHDFLLALSPELKQKLRNSGLCKFLYKQVHYSQEH